MANKRIKDFNIKDARKFVELRQKDGNWNSVAINLMLLLEDEPKHFKNLWFKLNKRKVFDKKYKKYKIDIEINNDPKSTNGKGLTAFYNTILVLAFRKYLFETARIKPPFYIIDSPLLGLDVGHTHVNKNNLTQGIYNYFVNSVNQSQLIIIENEKDMPNINLKNPKIKFYDFTHDEDEGRYVFLLDFKD